MVANRELPQTPKPKYNAKRREKYGGIKSDGGPRREPSISYIKLDGGCEFTKSQIFHFMAGVALSESTTACADIRLTRAAPSVTRHASTSRAARQFMTTSLPDVTAGML